MQPRHYRCLQKSIRRSTVPLPFGLLRRSLSILQRTPIDRYPSRSEHVGRIEFDEQFTLVQNRRGTSLSADSRRLSRVQCQRRTRARALRQAEIPPALLIVVSNEPIKSIALFQPDGHHPSSTLFSSLRRLCLGRQRTERNRIMVAPNLLRLHTGDPSGYGAQVPAMVRERQF